MAMAFTIPADSFAHETLIAFTRTGKNRFDQIATTTAIDIRRYVRLILSNYLKNELKLRESKITSISQKIITFFFSFSEGAHGIAGYKFS